MNLINGVARDWSLLWKVRKQDVDYVLASTGYM